MPLVGTLSTMPLPDLLQWLGTASKTGTLRVEHGKVCKVIRMRGGRIVGCSSDDPPQRLGQFLLSRRKITEDQLRDALAAQDQPGSSPRPLGMILVDMQALSTETVLAELAFMAEEIVFSLFDWDHGTFRFEDKALEDNDPFAVDLVVEELMLRGLQRHDELKRIREVFHDPLLILRYTSKPPGAEIFSDQESRSMYSAIDGDRSITEVVLQVHGSPFRVEKFLFGLHEDGLVEICGIKPAEKVTRTDPGSEAAARSVPAPNPQAEPTPAAPARTDAAEVKMPGIDLGVSMPASTGPGSDAPENAPPSSSAVATTLDAPAAIADPPAEVPPPAPPLDPIAGSRLSAASQLMADGEFEQALDILDELYRVAPGDEALRRLTAEAEAAFIDRTYRHIVPASKVPVLVKELDSIDSESLTPQECFLLSRIDGTWNVKSIIQVAPFREVEALRALKRMRETGMVDLKDPS